MLRTGSLLSAHIPFVKASHMAKPDITRVGKCPTSSRRSCKVTPEAGKEMGASMPPTIPASCLSHSLHGLHNAQEQKIPGNSDA